MKILVIKLGASGDVIRTTTLLHLFNEGVDWITSDANAILLYGLPKVNKIITESELNETKFDEYDLIINLEDSLEAANILQLLKYKDLFGSYLDKSGKIVCTESSKEWFDLSLISKYGINKANQLKFENQKSFQELVFSGLGYKFNYHPYLLLKTTLSNLMGDVAIPPKAGKVWTMKNWQYYNEPTYYLVSKGLIVNYLPQRNTMLEHLADVRNHAYLISGDSLPMHFALGINVSCISLFICTSLTEIFDYEIQNKIISPQLDKYFYRRDYDENAVKSISLENVINVFEQIKEKKNVYAYC